MLAGWSGLGLQSPSQLRLGSSAVDDRGLRGYIITGWMVDGRRRRVAVVDAFREIINYSFICPADNIYLRGR